MGLAGERGRGFVFTTNGRGARTAAEEKTRKRQRQVVEAFLVELGDPPVAGDVALRVLHDDVRAHAGCLSSISRRDGTARRARQSIA
jgi:hypothetical protein